VLGALPEIVPSEEFVPRPEVVPVPGVMPIAEVAPRLEVMPTPGVRLFIVVVLPMAAVLAAILDVTLIVPAMSPLVVDGKVLPGIGTP
jgi:hypothetical protein